MLLLATKVAVQVRPSSAVARLLRLALSATRSPTSKAMTFSEKRMVTVALSPALSSVLSSAMLCTCGAEVSTL